MKRLLDLGVAVGGLVLLAPLLGLVAVLVLIFHGRPVLFRQIRPGLHGRPFEVVKFRTMRRASSQAQLAPERDAERLTWFGRFLRRTSLDELPQLWNVLTGEMSLVGPRPLLMEYLDLYSAEQRRRHEVRPGITGWAQVRGRNAVDWDERLELDVWYVDHQSLLLDLRIILLTVLTVFSSRGVTQPGRATVDPFRGSGRGALGGEDES